MMMGRGERARRVQFRSAPKPKIEDKGAARLDLVQWPAMVVTIGAAWGAGSTRQGLRRLGFWLFLLSNVLWVIWGVHANAYALIVLQLFLAMTNIRGARNNDPEEAPAEA